MYTQGSVDDFSAAMSYKGVGVQLWRESKFTESAAEFEKAVIRLPHTAAALPVCTWWSMGAIHFAIHIMHVLCKMLQTPRPFVSNSFQRNVIHFRDPTPTLKRGTDTQMCTQLH